MVPRMRRTKLYFIFVLTFLLLSCSSSSQFYLDYEYSPALSRFNLPTQDGGFIFTSWDDGKTNIIKMNKNGEVEWEKIDPCSLFSMVEIAGDSFASVGYCINEKDETHPSFLKLFNSAGELTSDIQLSRKIPAGGSIETDFIIMKSLLPVDKGNFLVGGQYVKIRSKLYGYAYLQKIDIRGKKIWEKTFTVNSSPDGNGESDDEIMSITKNKNGILVLAENTRYPHHKLFMQVKSDGNVEWKKNIADIGEELVVTQDGSFLFADLDGRDQQYVEIVKVNSSGETIWKNRYSLPNGKRVVATSDGFLVICTQFADGKGDLLVHKYDNEGNLESSTPETIPIKAENTYFFSGLLLKDKTPVFIGQGMINDKSNATKLHIATIK